ncbi:O-antigen ligase family protein [Bradyrhizobium sediminis]|uniref:O-antigen ligase family protein n=1 Tax=Bradyrhizobium sediminis TaxID=2840469 RepID=A0A975RPI6_9BRAD|nr:O-antigen ligase family protein [Bradyrhizobium sediminis]QWG14894.1 O-antigen ligase family protein [Bradyrhizobium sediminis]
MNETRLSFHIPAKWRDVERWRTTADVFATLAAVTLPWSTSLPAIFIVLWLVALTPTLEVPHVLEMLRRPVCALPIAFAALALIGTLWSEVAWAARIHSASSSVKFFVLPLLFYHFERSTRGAWLLAGFIGSCFLLEILSWIVTVKPNLSLKRDAVYGVPVKNWIDQGQEFVFCAVVLVWAALRLLRSRKPILAIGFMALATSFFLNMAFVNVSRTALVCLPIMLLMLILLELNLREMLLTITASIVLVAVVWISSPLVRTKAEAIFTDFISYRDSRASTSGGQRLEFWRKSLGFVAIAPIIGHGTGSTLSLFEQAAVNQTGVSAEVVANPHNQTLYSAIQWGSVGVLILFAMWLAHLLLFRGEEFAARVGFLVVLQNIVGSLFNSHLLDFHEGWMYVLGVGVAGGILMKKRHDETR